LRYLNRFFFYRLEIYRRICGGIPERNRTSVSYVGKGMELLCGQRLHLERGRERERGVERGRGRERER